MEETTQASNTATHPPDTLPSPLADLSDLLVTWHASETVPRRAVNPLLGTPDNQPYVHRFAEASVRPWRVEWNSDWLTLNGTRVEQPFPCEGSVKSE